MYFLRSDRVRILLTNDLSLEVDSSAVADMRHGKSFIRNLVLYYCIFSTLGHCMEAGFCYLVSLGLFQGDIDFNNTMLFRDWLYPFPMHGVAVVLVALTLWPLKEALARRFNRWVTLVISFFVNMLFCTGIEFAGACCSTTTCSCGTTPTSRSTSWARSACRTPSASDWPRR